MKILASIQKSLFAVIMVSLFMAILPGCDSTHPAQEKFTTFAEHLEQVKNAKFSDYKGLPDVAVRDEAEFEKMKSHILSMYEGVTVNHSFVEADGMYVDCIPFDQQPSLKALKLEEQSTELEAPQPADLSPEKAGSENKSTGVDISLKKGSVDEFGNEKYCPKGSIPMRRLQLETMVRFETLDSFFSKTGNAEEDSYQVPTDRAGETHYYAHAYQNVANYGGESWMNLWNPTVSTNQMSLTQQWYVGGTGASRQTVEGGAQVYPAKYGNNKACLFIYYTNANYVSGSGGYNLDVAGFVQTNNSIVLGSNFSNYSTTNGTQYEFGMQWQRASNGNWWLFYRTSSTTIAVGYYPRSRFNNGQMAYSAQKVDFGGEDTGKPSAKQMGSGAFANTGWAKAAYQRNLFYINTANTSAWASLTTSITSSSCYTISNYSGGSGSWVNYFYFGGPSCN